MLALCLVCGVCLSVALLAVARLRTRLSKHRGAALSFAVPGALMALPVAWFAAHGEVVALVPLMTIAALCFAAAALFTPTRPPASPPSSASSGRTCSARLNRYQPRHDRLQSPDERFGAP